MGKVTVSLLIASKLIYHRLDRSSTTKLKQTAISTPWLTMRLCSTLRIRPMRWKLPKKSQTQRSKKSLWSSSQQPRNQCKRWKRPLYPNKRPKKRNIDPFGWKKRTPIVMHFWHMQTSMINRLSTSNLSNNKRIKSVKKNKKKRRKLLNP